MTVGQTQSLSFSTSRVINSASWYSASWDIVEVTSHGVTTAQIKAIKSFSSYVIVRCDYYYWITSGTYRYLAAGFEDFNIYVNPINPTNINIQSSLTMDIGDYTTITPTLTPSNAETTLTWSSDKTSVATVSSSGQLHAISSGTANITVRTSNSLYSTCKVTVQTIGPKTVQLNAAGTLSSVLTATELANITDLTITGTIDARDFKTMRDNMPALSSIDLSAVSVAAYTGTYGTYSTSSTVYPANEIPQSAFNKKTILANIKLPVLVTSIGNDAFNSCIGLKSVTIPASVVSIGNSAFYRCNGLATVVIPSSVTSIGSTAFYYCSSLGPITIPSSVTSIGFDAFWGSSGLIDVDVANITYSSAEGLLFNKAQTVLIQCPNSKKGNYTIPSTVISIGYGAFATCSGLVSVTIPSSVTSIGESAFWWCSGLTSIYASAATPVDISSVPTVFQNVNNTTCLLYVPIGSKAAYHAADQWKDFSNIIESTTSTEFINDRLININVVNGQLRLAGMLIGENLSVYDIQGRIIYNKKTNTETIEIRLPNRGVYVIRIGSRSLKVIN